VTPTIESTGSNSQISLQVGLDNKIKLNEWKLIQARASIDNVIRERLLESLQRYGSTMYLGGVHATGFASIYDSQCDPVSETERT
jgi:hypothetical protein